MSSDDGAEGVRPTGVATLDDADLDDLLSTLRAARNGDFSSRWKPGRNGRVAEVADALNALLERNDQMSRELVRVGKIIGREGRMTERAELDGAAGAWATGVEALNALIDDLVRPTTEVARVIGAVADGDLSQKMALKIGGQPVKGEFLQHRHHRQHDGRPALGLRRRGDARGPRGRHRGQARRAGRGAGGARAPGRTSPSP